MKQAPFLSIFTGELEPGALLRPSHSNRPVFRYRIR